MTGWLDRLLNDPISDNPWSLALTVAVLAGPFLAAIEYWRRSRGKESPQVEEIQVFCSPTQCSECPHCNRCGGSMVRGGPYGCTCDDEDYSEDDGEGW